MVYLPEHFAESDLAAIHTLIERHPLGLLITLGSDGLAANHIPFVLDRGYGEYGRLLGHVARNNTVWCDHSAEPEALVVFQAAEGYISPNWYPTKQEHHRAVPTWNYAVAHAYGPLLVHDDVKWLRGQAGRLTKMMEAPQPVPWKMADAPQDYTAMMLENIVGIEIPLTRLIGKVKANQNRDLVDRHGAITGLRAAGDPGDAAMADVMAAALPD
ncbi:MAG: FMN-binding negative transcriptional regulator [Thermomicrobiales bacterium]|nr:FMN-binding negative transcriptional regulator [Thermomicrobiales bacterium]